MEAAEEATRQLRLRDLAGLIVIDFIDMEESKNNRAVEKVLKDCLARDRARVQMGRISGFGLMEISRQRRRTGVLEGSTHVCEHCQGTGRLRSVESSALAALRAVELEAVRGGGGARERTPAVRGGALRPERQAQLRGATGADPPAGGRHRGRSGAGPRRGRDRPHRHPGHGRSRRRRPLRHPPATAGAGRAAGA